MQHASQGIPGRARRQDFGLRPVRQVDVVAARQFLDRAVVTAARHDPLFQVAAKSHLHTTPLQPAGDDWLVEGFAISKAVGVAGLGEAPDRRLPRWSQLEHCRCDIGQRHFSTTVPLGGRNITLTVLLTLRPLGQILTYPTSAKQSPHW